MSKIQVDTIDTRSGTSTMQIGSTNTSTITLGVSGDTINVPSGVTFANAGTATGFGANTPRFKAFRSADQTVSDNTWTKVELGTEVYDTDSAWDISNHRFTVPSGKGGVYFFSGNCGFQSNAVSDIGYAAVQLNVNGSYPTSQSAPASNLYNDTTGIFRSGQLSFAGTLNLSAGDYVEMYGRIDDINGANIALASSFMEGHKLI